MKKYQKVVIAHRGLQDIYQSIPAGSESNGYAMNPDYEQDLVLSKDNVPIVIHDIYLGNVTDVAKSIQNVVEKMENIM